jgi:hypothetical protein
MRHNGIAARCRRRLRLGNCLAQGAPDAGGHQRTPARSLGRNGVDARNLSGIESVVLARVSGRDDVVHAGCRDAVNDARGHRRIDLSVGAIGGDMHAGDTTQCRANAIHAHGMFAAAHGLA